MKIEQFITDRIIIPRLSVQGVLVVYDTDHQYKDLIFQLASKSLKIIDCSISSIESREEALRILQDIGKNKSDTKSMIVYVPVKAPLSDEEKQRDPFYIYALYNDANNQNSLFPDPNNSSDEFLSICLRAKPTHTTEIRKIFNQNPIPAFNLINAIESENSWPTLKILFESDSPSDIIFNLLHPSEGLESKLKADTTWFQEIQELLQTSIGLQISTNQSDYSSISEQLWIFILFSEFAFDLPESLPKSLETVQHAPAEAENFIYDLCDRLRNDVRSQGLYIDKAISIENKMNLPNHCKEVADYGIRDTFPFEEDQYIKKAISTLRESKIDAARHIVCHHAYTIWISRGESQITWNLIKTALGLLEKITDNERELPGNSKSLKKLIDFYIESIKDVDRLHREFEQAATDVFHKKDILEDIIDVSRKKYREFVNTVQTIFLKLVTKEGWPLAGMTYNGDVFNKFVKPHLKNKGNKVAYILVDALRYEMGCILKKQLQEDAQVDLHTSLALLPSITSVGMASLCPDAGQNLSIKNKDGNISVSFADKEVNTSIQRMKMISDLYGERFTEMTLQKFLDRKKKLDNEVDLLIVRSVEIDSTLENNPEYSLGIVLETIKRIRYSVNKLSTFGFNKVVIATDHGFVLNPSTEPGDVCVKPKGDWVMVHNRMLLGSGNESDFTQSIPVQRLGIKGDFDTALFPSNLVSFKAGDQYFHGGLSLPEAVIPVIILEFKQNKAKGAGEISASLTYKNGAKRITSRLPVFDLELESTGLFDDGESFELRMEAVDNNGNIVGKAKSSDKVNPATDVIQIQPGEKFKIPMAMDADYEGPFIVKVLEPKMMMTLASLELETDYVV